MLIAKNLCCATEDGATIIKDFNIEIKKGDVIAIIGPSGAGKSMLIKTLAMVRPPAMGELFFEGKNIVVPGEFDVETRMKMGMVFQEYNLFPHLTIVENAMLTLIMKKGFSRQEAFDHAMACLRRVGLAEKYLSYPKELSAGQKQRGEIARIMAMDPDIIFFDDPTSSMDLVMEGEVGAVMEDLAKSGTTLVLATSSLALARRVAKTVIFFVGGKIYEMGSAQDIFENSKKKYTEEFVGGLKSLSIIIDSKDYDFIHAISEIDMFGMFYRLPKTLRNRIMLVFEESYAILEHVLDEPRISYKFEKSDDNEIIITLKYNGKRYNLSDTYDYAPITILESAAKIIESRGIEDDVYTNKVVFRVNEESLQKE